MDKSSYTLLPNRADNKCFGCGPANPHGLQMQFYTNGRTVASWITIPPHLSGWSNLAHGGILFTALDEVMGRSIVYLLKRFVLTKSITIEYRKPVPLGREFKVEGRILEVRSEREAAAEGIITKLSITSQTQGRQGAPMDWQCTYWLFPEGGYVALEGYSACFVLQVGRRLSLREHHNDTS